MVCVLSAKCLIFVFPTADQFGLMVIVTQHMDNIWISGASGRQVIVLYRNQGPAIELSRILMKDEYKL